MAIPTSWKTGMKFIVIVLVVLFLYMEWGIYKLYPWLYWPPFHPQSGNSLRILIIGDPQLLGHHYTENTVFEKISRWDCDRYIKQTFLLTLNHLNPDLFIFLGDNTDEGEVAGDEEFKEYLERFMRVFEPIDFNNKAIIIPGDNDIGGENELPRPQAVERFNNYFRKDPFIQIKFVDFLKVNLLTATAEHVTALPISSDRYRIIISHIPVMGQYHYFINEVMKTHPNLILSAHEHISAHITYSNGSGMLMDEYPWAVGKKLQTLNLNDKQVHEIVVPTCSYRMGKEKIGYGAAILEHDGTLHYTVLWLPSRFFQLYTYIVFLVVLGLMLVLLAIRRLSFHNRFYTHLPVRFQRMK
ncbi:metallophosphoesterase [Tachypleus tridentatus]|uniref:metallophosphoesterase n=1 Tax=Tachypleus tridentatus TaxID=6853 RepID=UPI003FD62E05